MCQRENSYILADRTSSSGGSIWRGPDDCFMVDRGTQHKHFMNVTLNMYYIITNKYEYM